VDLPAGFRSFAEPALVIRSRDGRYSPEYSATRLSFGYPPDVGT
jgi:hypothetical protein